MKEEWPFIQWDALIQNIWSIEVCGRLLSHVLDHWTRPRIGGATGAQPNRVAWLERKSISYLLEHYIAIHTPRFHNVREIGADGVSRPVNWDWVHTGCKTGITIHEPELIIAIEAREVLWCEDLDRTSTDRVKRSFTLKTAHLCIEPVVRGTTDVDHRLRLNPWTSHLVARPQLGTGAPEMMMTTHVESTSPVQELAKKLPKSRTMLQRCCEKWTERTKKDAGVWPRGGTWDLTLIIQMEEKIKNHKRQDKSDKRAEKRELELQVWKMFLEEARERKRAEQEARESEGTSLNSGDSRPPPYAPMAKQSEGKRLHPHMPLMQINGTAPLEEMSTGQGPQMESPPVEVTGVFRATVQGGDVDSLVQQMGEIVTRMENMEKREGERQQEDQAQTEEKMRQTLSKEQEFSQSSANGLKDWRLQDECLSRFSSEEDMDKSETKGSKLLESQLCESTLRKKHGEIAGTPTQLVTSILEDETEMLKKNVEDMERFLESEETRLRTERCQRRTVARYQQAREEAWKEIE